MKNVKQRMIEDMKLRGVAPRTQHRYLHTITALAEHYHRQPGEITEKQVRKYLLYLIESKRCAKTTFNVDLCAIKFLYRRTLGRTVIDECSRTYLDAVHPPWEAMYLNAIIAAGSSMRITPVVTAVARNAIRATSRHGSRRERRNSCRYRIIM